jgi:hypothetical protein
VILSVAAMVINDGVERTAATAPATQVERIPKGWQIRSTHTSTRVFAHATVIDGVLLTEVIFITFFRPAIGYCNRRDDPKR